MIKVMPKRKVNQLQSVVAMRISRGYPAATLTSQSIEAGGKAK